MTVDKETYKPIEAQPQNLFMRTKALFVKLFMQGRNK